ncbi:hypothetical protein CsSME_00025933 [Camellia sinensis var. sinensis]
MLRDYLRDPFHVIEPTRVVLSDDYTYEERPIQIVNRRIKKLRNKEIPLVKVDWKNHGDIYATWEREDDMMKRYPELFPLDPVFFQNEALKANLEIPDLASTLERPSFCSELRSSDGMLARAEELCLTLKRASSGDFQHLSTLERPLCFGKLARAKKATLERDPCFSKNLKSRSLSVPMLGTTTVYCYDGHQLTVQSVKTYCTVLLLDVPHITVMVSKHRTDARSIRLSSRFVKPTIVPHLEAFGNHGLLASCGAEPIGTGLGHHESGNSFHVVGVAEKHKQLPFHFTLIYNLNLCQSTIVLIFCGSTDMPSLLIT